MPGNFCHSVTGSDASKPAILTCDNICERALKRCFSPLRRRGQYLAKLDPASHCKHFQECRRSRGWSQPLTYNGRASLSTTKTTKRRVTKATKGRATGVLTTNRHNFTFGSAAKEQRAKTSQTQSFNNLIGGRMVSNAMSV